MTGAPGVGKTYVVRKLHEKWTAEGFKHLLIPIEQLGAATPEEIAALFRGESSLIALLSREFGDEQGVVLFDGVDAARNEQTRERILSLMRQVVASGRTNWTVLATVRTYDATRSQKLRDLFPRIEEPPPVRGRTLSEARHIVVPPFTDDEVANAIQQIDGLPAVVASASRDFNELLRIPFNLWLVERLVRLPSAQVPLTAASSSPQLLGIFWARRVLTGENPDATRQLLYRAVRSMVAENLLTTDRDVLREGADPDAWSEVFSTELLVAQGANEKRIGFAHNILFDYAVSVLLLDDERRTLERFFDESPSRPFFLRPSVIFLFTRLWHDQREVFWELALTSLESSSPHLKLVARIIPPAVVVDEARVKADLDPLFKRIDSESAIAREFLLRVFQATRALATADRSPWVEVAAMAAERASPIYIWDAVSLAAGVLERAGETSSESQRRAAGVAGRAALRWALQERSKRPGPFVDNVGAFWGTRLTAITYATDAAASESLLRAVLGLVGQPNFPIQYLNRLCDCVAELAPVAPALAATVYEVVFSHDEVSEEKTDMGTPILPMTSTRRQDFRMCAYTLLREFDAFAKAAPLAAVAGGTRGASAALKRDRFSSNASDQGGRERVKFTFENVEVEIAPDPYGFWLESAHPDDEHALLFAVIEQIERTIEAGDSSTARAMLECFARNASVASAWAALIRAAAKKPALIGPLIGDLGSVPFFVEQCYHWMGKLVTTSFSSWTEHQRRQFESVLLGLYEQHDKEEDEDGRRSIPDVLTDAVPAELIESVELRERKVRIQARGGAPNDIPPVTFSVSSRDFSHEDWLAEQGVDTVLPQNRQLLDSSERLKALTQPWQNGRMLAEQRPALVGAVVDLREMLRRLSAEASSEVVASSLTRLCDAAGVIARSEGDLTIEEYELAAAVLLEAVSTDAALPENPAENAEEEEGFTSPAWSPSPVTEAAQGLAWLALRDPDRRVIQAMEQLAKSLRPAVRFLTALDLWRVRGKAEADFWRIVGEIVERERNEVVLSALLSSLSYLPKVDVPRISEVVRRVHARGLEPKGRSALLDSYSRLLAWLGLNAQDEWAIERVGEIAAHPLHAGALAEHLVRDLLFALAPEQLRDEPGRALAGRCLTVLRTTVHGVGVPLQQAELPTDLTVDAPETAYRIVDEVASRLYFLVRHESDDGKARSGLDANELERYFALVQPLLEDVIAFGKLPRTALIAHSAHHLVELLRIMLPVNPRLVLHLCAEVVTVTAEKGNYHLDSMAVKEVVAIAESFLSDHREAIMAGDSLADFVRLMDVFAKAGWPEALRVLWRLDEVFR